MCSIFLRKEHGSDGKNPKRKCDLVPALNRFGAGFIWFAQSMSSIRVARAVLGRVLARLGLLRVGRRGRRGGQRVLLGVRGCTFGLGSII